MPRMHVITATTLEWMTGPRSNFGDGGMPPVGFDPLVFGKDAVAYVQFNQLCSQRSFVDVELDCFEQ